MYEWSRKARQSLEVYSTPQLEQKVLRLLTAWFAAHIPDKSDAVRDMQMAVDANGQLLEGYFEAQENRRMVQVFCDEDQGRRMRQDPNAWGTKMASGLQQQPADIPTSKVVQEYSAAKRLLFTDPSNQQVWADFLKGLKASQMSLDEYRHLGGDVKTSLQQEIEFCQLVLDAWEIFATASPEGRVPVNVC